MRFIMAIFCAALITAVSTSADARPKHKQTRMLPVQGIIVCDQQGCHGDRNISTPRRERVTEVVYEGRVVGGRPPGCPHRYCGCGVSLKVFGRIIPELNLAANWVRKFPRTSPSAGMVAARRGHVFQILSMIDANTAMAYDPNSGGGKTRIHERSLRGYTVVDPHGARLALN